MNNPSGYQDIVVTGSFPTVNWFTMLPRTSGTVIDVGCNTGTLSYLYSLEAQSVDAIDSNPEFIEYAKYLYPRNNIYFQCGRAEDHILRGYDISVFSMIIHWLENPKEVIQKYLNYTRKYAVFIHRLPNEGYKTPDNGNWFPTIKELSFSSDFRLVTHNILMEQDNGKQIALSIFERKYVTKRSNKCDDSWWKKVEVLGIKSIAWVPGGYKMPYYDGIDLQEDRPFSHRHDKVRFLKLNPIQKRNVANLFKNEVKAALETGYLIGDLTRRNIIMCGNTPYRIDFDMVFDINNLPESVISTRQEMLDYLEIDFKFTGDLKELYKIL